MAASKKATRKPRGKKSSPSAASKPQAPDPFDLEDEDEEREESVSKEPPRETEETDSWTEDLGEPLREAAPPEPAEKPKPVAKPGPKAELLVRIRPYNPKRGQTMRSFGFKGSRFKVEQGWYRVPREIGEYLSGVRCSDLDPDSQLAFDVCSEAEARRIIEAEANEADRGTPAKPILP